MTEDMLPLAGDDGYETSLRYARCVCGAVLLLPVVLVPVTAVVIARGPAPHEVPILVATLFIVGLTVMVSPGLVREELARRVIGRHLAAPAGTSPSAAVYRGFANANIAAYAISATGVAFGFISSVATGMWTPLFVGLVLSAAMWWALWPRRTVWKRWTWQAKLHRDETAPLADGIARQP